VDAAVQRVADQVRAATASRSPVCICGSGSKAFYGGAPTGTPLEMAAVSGICSYEPTEMVITARAGTPLAEIEAVLAEKSQCLAFEPPRFDGGGTVGGMVAAGLAGPARAAVGGVRDFVLGLTLLDGRGQLLQFGGQVMKNVAGYDVSRLLAGSMGILGVIVEVSLKVPPPGAARQTLAFACDQKTAIEQVQQWAALAVPIRASAWHRGTLHVRLEGALAAVESNAVRLTATHAAAVLEPAAAAEFWSELRDQQSAFFRAPPKRPGPALARPDGAAPAAGRAATLWRLSVPPAHPPLDLDGEPLVEWGGGQRWVYSDAPASRMRALAARAGGHASAFRGAIDRSEAFAPLSPPLERIHRNLKAAFDPAGIFNRGRLYPWL
jgi:FAD/FMN-containing dehydrogenase